MNSYSYIVKAILTRVHVHVFRNKIFYSDLLVQVIFTCLYYLFLRNPLAGGHSRSKPMPPIERESMTSYSTLMVTMVLSASISKLQPSEICLPSIWPRSIISETELRISVPMTFMRSPDIRRFFSKEITVFQLKPLWISVTSILNYPGHPRWKSMAPSESPYMTSYPSLIVNLALSARVSKLQPSEICVTSILTSPGHSRSKPMAPFERASMTSYSTLMVTMALSASVSKLQPSEIGLKYAWPRFHFSRSL